MKLWNVNTAIMLGVLSVITTTVSAEPLCVQMHGRSAVQVVDAIASSNHKSTILRLTGVSSVAELRAMLKQGLIYVAPCGKFCVGGDVLPARIVNGKVVYGRTSGRPVGPGAQSLWVCSADESGRRTNCQPEMLAYCCNDLLPPYRPTKLQNLPRYYHNCSYNGIRCTGSTHPPAPFRSTTR